MDPFAGVITDPDTLHKYLYVGADAVNHIDPSGLAETVEYSTRAADQARRTVVFIKEHGRQILCLVLHTSSFIVTINGGPEELIAIQAVADAFGLFFCPCKLNVGGPLKVYRGLSATDDITKGIFARAPGAGNSPISHVAKKFLSQWISTTKSFTIARLKYGTYGVVEIDLTKVFNEVVDLSNGIPGTPGMLSNWAKKDLEVLIKDFIPPEAIKKVKCE